MPPSVCGHISTAGLQIADGLNTDTKGTHQINGLPKAWGALNPGMLSKEST